MSSTAAPTELPDAFPDNYASASSALETGSSAPLLRVSTSMLLAEDGLLVADNPILQPRRSSVYPLGVLGELFAAPESARGG